MSNHVSVTQDDIDQGQRANAAGCPIAAALGRTGGSQSYQPWESQYWDGVHKAPGVVADIAKSAGDVVESTPGFVWDGIKWVVGK